MSLKKVTLASLILLGLTACISNDEKKPDNTGRSISNAAQATPSETTEANSQKQQVPTNTTQTTPSETVEASSQKQQIPANTTQTTPNETAGNNSQNQTPSTESQNIANIDDLNKPDRVAEIYEKFIAAGLNQGLAKGYAEKYAEFVTDEQLEADIRDYAGSGLTERYTLGLTKSGNELIYKQRYSVTTIPNHTSFIDYDNKKLITEGLETKIDKIPNEGKAIYTGKAYGAFNTNGELSYSVDFKARTGSGIITGIERFKDNIILETGSIKENSIVSSTRIGTENKRDSQYDHLYRYEIKFFGPKAEEIGGKAVTGDYTFGLAGTRGEIQK
ncbi:factor H binding protein domain-containing protein [Ursidibacter sp. B-7004-1]